MSSEVIFRTSKLCKSFGPTRAVVDVDLELRRGELDRRAFFQRLIRVVSDMGGEMADVF